MKEKKPIFEVEYTGPQRMSLVPKGDLKKRGISAALEVLKGGPGSGNHGHSGRPGSVGGSGSGGGGGKSPSNSKDRRNNMKRSAGKASGKLGKAKKALKAGKTKEAHQHLKEVAGHVKDSLHGLAGKAHSPEQQKLVHHGLAQVKEAEHHLAQHAKGGHGEGHEGGHNHLHHAFENLGELVHHIVEEAHHTLLHKE